MEEIGYIALGGVFLSFFFYMLGKLERMEKLMNKTFATLKEVLIWIKEK